MIEQAPPAPPSAGTPELYLTPQLQKRRDGLCPGLFTAFGKLKGKKVDGGMIKEYRTNSKLLLQVEEREGIPREILELQTLVDSVSTGLKEYVSNSRDVISLDFVPKGLNSTLDWAKRMRISASKLESWQTKSKVSPTMLQKHSCSQR